jgi:glycosyltransferase involved in cell wall biosynthesis
LTACGHHPAVRIALLSDTYTPQVNGVTTVVERIARVVRAAGHDAVIVAPRYPGAGAPADAPSELRIPSAPFPPYPAIRLALPRFRAVARFLDQAGPDLVHVATEGPIGLAGRRYAATRSLPLVTSFHTNFPQYARHYGAGLLAPLVWHWLRWFHRPARLTQTPGDAVCAELLHRRVGRPVVWGRGVDARHFHPRRRSAAVRRGLAGSSETTIVLHVGRLAPEKNLDVLAAAWTAAHRRLGSRATFVLAGEGPATPRLLDRMPWVRHLGFLDRDRLADLYASADLCVLPSHTETCGLVALEAMASGLAVVAADAGGFRESLTPDVSGLLAPPHEPDAFAAAIVALVAAPNRRAELGRAARAAAERRDVEAEDAVLLEQYAALAGGRPAREVSPCAA